jgi:hypothetical protein
LATNWQPRGSISPRPPPKATKRAIPGPWICRLPLSAVLARARARTMSRKMGSTTTAPAIPRGAPHRPPPLARALPPRPARSKPGTNHLALCDRRSSRVGQVYTLAEPVHAALGARPMRSQPQKSSLSAQMLIPNGKRISRSAPSDRVARSGYQSGAKFVTSRPPRPVPIRLAAPRLGVRRRVACALRLST